MGATKKVLPEDAKERIDLRIDCSDRLTLPDGDLEKADLLLELIESEYTAFLPSEEVLARWGHAYSRIGTMLSIIRDYVIKAQEELKAADAWLEEGIRADKEIKDA